MAKRRNIYIWDMDETLILLRSLLNGSYAGAFNGLKDVEHGITIGKLWESHILRICDKDFLYEQIENFNQPHLHTLSQFDDGVDLRDYQFNQDGFGHPLDDVNKRKLAYRHRMIAEKYCQGLQGIINVDMWTRLYNLTDTYTDGWLSAARNCLEKCEQGTNDSGTFSLSNGQKDADFKHFNILVTSGPLVPSLVKCLLYQLNGIFACSNVYSSLDVGKLQCFKWIKERFPGPENRFCVVGDGAEECEAAESMSWPFVQIDLRPESVCRFPGLTPEDLRHYFSVVYGTDEDTEGVMTSRNQ